MKNSESKETKNFSIIFLDAFASKFSKLMEKYASYSASSLKFGLTVVFGLVLTAGVIISSFLPPLDYLPDGNRNFVFARIMVPSGYNKEATLEISRAMERAAQPLWEAENDGPSLDVYNDGIRVIEIPFEGRLIELILTSDKANNNKIDDIKNLPLILKTGEIVRLSQVADINLIGVPKQIKRLSGRRVITLQLRPHESISLENAVLKLQNSVINPTIKNIPEGVSINLSGAASELERTWIAMKNNVMIALFVIFLLLTVLMKSFVLPLVIMITVPVAGAGGVLGLVFLNQFSAQPLDMLTMLGFIILAGIVVNNSILMVEQTLWHIRHESMIISEAITEATRNRIRPIFMSTLTSLFGLIPLVIFPGSGSELYRGIGTVVFGGLATSAILTLLMVPPLLALALKTEKLKPISEVKEDLFI